ncbi:MAG: hypothetical protein HON76_10415 [Candidatus Scalindua sp.]|jgi:hypothetical protein|nr:hypothetical protein [Candidatus Scalindua sp.]MBT5304359.1 hypothetical protein [Candidatus Scalindua sp.]MBT6051818.1 hypothetical protein [Candidatus Scalindua sp.]MBT6228163.1 hypothetical protein [Candidatus Scalindua sp.]MBT6562926.1 hypothetical protein [Candidatus Scalindua sp.]
MKSILIVSIISILFFVGLIVSDATNGAEVIELHNSGTLEKSDIKGFIKIKKSSLAKTWIHLNVSMIQKIEVGAEKQIYNSSVIFIYSGLVANPVPVKIIIPKSLMPSEDIVKLIASIINS